MPRENGPGPSLDRKSKGDDSPSKKSSDASRRWQWLAAAGLSAALLSGDRPREEMPQPTIKASAEKNSERVIMPNLRAEMEVTTTIPKEVQNIIVEEVRKSLELKVKKPEIQKILKANPEAKELTAAIHIDPLRLETTAVPETDAARIEQETAAAVKHAAIFFKPSHLVEPNLDIHVLKPGEEMSRERQPLYGAKDSQILIQIVHSITEVVSFKYHVDLPAGKSLDEMMAIDREHAFAGQANREAVFSRKNNQIAGVTLTRSPIIVEHSSDKVHQSAWSVTPGEILHNQLSTYTAARFGQDAIGMAMKFPDDPKINALQEKYIRQEEAVVHAADLLWVQAYAKEQGKPMTEEQVSVWRNMYPGTAELLEAVKDLSPQDGANRIIEWFKKDPKKIEQLMGL